jgi:hypothetical protein
MLIVDHAPDTVYVVPVSAGSLFLFFKANHDIYFIRLNLYLLLKLLLDEEEIVWSESEQKTSSEKKTVLPLE